MTKPLWTSDDITLATGGIATAPFTVTGTVSIDTRSLQPGDLFVALKDQRDGHDFVEAAFESGAAGALVSRKKGEGPQVVADDTLTALEQLGVAARARCAAHRTAITGSAGKTSVKEMLARIYRALGPAHWSQKSFNNHWGVPLTLARMPEETERAVFEIGMSTPGEIAPRSRMVRPHTGIITCIAGAHLEGLGSLEAVAREKADIFEGLEAGGTFILPSDDTFFEYLADRARSLCPTGNMESFGRGPDATARVVGYETDGVTSRIQVDVVGKPVLVRLEAVGEHWAMNVAAALLAATQTGAAVNDCAEALSGYAPPAGRGTAERLESAEPVGHDQQRRLLAHALGPAGDQRGRGALFQRLGDEIMAIARGGEGDEEVAGLQGAGVDRHAVGLPVAGCPSSGGFCRFACGPQRHATPPSSAATATLACSASSNG